MKLHIVAIIVFVEAVGCSGPRFESPLFGDAGEGGSAWDGSSSSSSVDGSGSTYSPADGGYVAGSTGGGSQSGGGGSGGVSSASAGAGGGGASGTGGTGGSEPCGPATCMGCCDDTGQCQVGASDAACGQGGGVCDVCKSACGWDPPGAPFCSAGEGTGEAWFGCEEHACKPKLGQWSDMTWHDGICCAAPCNVQTGKCLP